MLRLAGFRLGGRLGRRATKTVIDAAVNAVLAELGVTLAKANKLKGVSELKPPAAVETPLVSRAEQLVAPPAEVSSPPDGKTTPSKEEVPPTRDEPVDLVLSGVNCTMLKHVLSSSSSSSTLTDVPDVARVLRLDYTVVSSQDQLAHLADILLVNRIHAAVVADTKKSEAGIDPDASANPYSPLVVLVETSLPREDAEVQQFIIHNALHMHPLPPEVATDDGRSIKTPVLTVLVLDDERTTRVRAMAGLPALPRSVPKAKTLEKRPKVNANAIAPDANATSTSMSGVAEVSPSKKSDPYAQHRSSATKSQGDPARRGGSDVEGDVETKETNSDGSEGVENVTMAMDNAPPSVGNAAAASLDADAAQIIDAALKASDDSADVKVEADKIAEPVPGVAATAPQPVEASTAEGSGSTGKPSDMVEASDEKDLLKRTRQYTVGRIPSETFIPHKKKKKPATATRFLLLESIADSIAGKGVAAFRPPRLLSVDSPHEKLMWASQPGRPLSVEVLGSLVRPDVYKSILAAAKASSTESASASPLTMHMVVYSVGNEVSASRVWIGALQAASDLASALSGGASQLPTELVELVGLDSWRVRRITKRRMRRQNERKEAVANSLVSIDSVTSAHIITAASQYPILPRPYIYILIHTRLSKEDADVFHQELDYYVQQLKETPAGPELAGVSILTADDASPTRLSYVLDHSMVDEESSTADDVNAQRAKKQLVVQPMEKVIPVKKTEVRRIFDEVYRLLSEERWLYRLPAPPDALLSPPQQQQQQQQETPASSAQQQQQETPASSAQQQQQQETPASSAQQQQQQETPASPPKEKQTFPFRKQWPDANIPATEALRVAVLTQILLQHKEAQLRKHFEAAVNLRETTTSSPPTLATGPQRQEMKSAVTEAVEEVSARHEQATAHLVKTLSSTLEQLSPERLSDTLEALVRNEVKPIMDALEDRLGNSPASASVAASTDAGSLMTSQEQDDMKSIMSQLLTGLRELNERTSALGREPASAQIETSAEPADTHPSEKTVTQLQSEEEVRLLRNLYAQQVQHHTELSEEMEKMRHELRALASRERPAAEAREPTSVSGSMIALSPESLAKAVADTTHEVTTAIRKEMHSTIVRQLDTYCDVHRSTLSSIREDGSGAEPSTPLLPVTSLELEEMLSRIVDHAVRESTNQVRTHVQAAMEAALRGELAASRASPKEVASTKNASAPDETLKAALEGLWAQVRAEAAEVEATKLSQHNHQLLRLFRRHQHLQRSASGGRPTTELASVSLPATSMTYVALEEAMRTVMHPYMMQMQATVASAAASAKVNASAAHSAPV